MIKIATLALFVVAVLATPEDELIAGTRTFAAKLYQEVIKTNPNKNVIFSPITIQTIMGLFLSAGVTETDPGVQEIINALNLPHGDANRQAAFQSVLESLNEADNDFKVYDATKMYIGTYHSITAWYQNIARVVFKSDVEIVNFQANKAAIMQNINQWVAQKTNNKITNFIDANDIKSTVQHTNILISALYLAGKWMKPFSKSNNTISTFHSPIGAQQVTMMRDERNYEYADTNNAQYLKIQLVKKDGDADMVFVLPKQGQTLSTLETNIHNLLQPVKFQTCKVQVTLPKFSFNGGINLKTILQTLGVRQVFTSGITLNGFFVPGHAIARLFVQEVLQKSVIDVDEWGVTAASASEAAMYVDDTSCTAVFTANQPFLFYITVNDAIVYTGRVMQI